MPQPRGVMALIVLASPTLEDEGCIWDKQGKADRYFRGRLRILLIQALLIASFSCLCNTHDMANMLIIAFKKALCYLLCFSSLELFICLSLLKHLSCFQILSILAHSFVCVTGGCVNLVGEWGAP